MKLFPALIVAMLAAFFLGGCAIVNTPALTLASELTTITVINHQPVAKQKPTAQVAYDVAGAIARATQENPDLSSIQAVARPLIAKEIAKVAPQDQLAVGLILDLALNAADAVYLQAMQSATATDKGKLAQSVVQAVTAGVQMGARVVLNPSPPPTTQPN